MPRPQRFVSSTSDMIDPDSRFALLTMEDGLSNDYLEVILQDRHGFMWIGTQDGLNRYDGYTFTVYKSEPRDPHSLSHNHIMDLAEVQDGSFAREWILENQAGRPVYNALKRIEAEHEIEIVGEKLRAMMPWLKPESKKG